MICKLMWLKILILFMSSAIVSCSSLNDTLPQKFTINKRWAVSTKSSTNWWQFKNHAASPVIHEKSVLVANGYDGIGLYKQSTGRAQWKIKIKNGVESTPIIENDRIYFGGNDGLFYCLNAKDGSIKWSFPIKFEGLGSPTLDDEYVYFTTGNHNLYSLSKSNGRLKWVYTRKVDSSISIRGQGKVLLEGDNLYAGFSDGYLVSFNKLNGQVIWEKLINSSRRFKDVDSSPVLNGDAIFISGYDENLYAINKNSGDTIWKTPYGSHTAVFIKDDKVYSSTSLGSVVALSKSNGKLIWKKTLKKGIGTEPTYYKGFLIIGESEGQILALSQINGEVVGQYETGKGVISKVTNKIDSKQFYSLSAGGNLFSFNIDWTKASDVWPWEK